MGVETSQLAPSGWSLESAFGASSSSSSGSSTAQPSQQSGYPRPSSSKSDTLDKPRGTAKKEKFHRILRSPSVDLAALREALWAGAPDDDYVVRAEAWQMLLGYMPPNRDRVPQGIARKRAEYEDLKRRHYSQQARDENPVTANNGGGALEAGEASVEHAEGELEGDAEGAAILRQIRIDIPRTSPGLSVFSQPRMQRLMERVLYIWSIRHPASGYVQGINDLITPFIVVLLAAELQGPLDDLDIESVSESVLNVVEAGAYWCLTKVLSDIQDHYTAGQPGIQKMVGNLKDIVRRIDQQLYRHLEQQGLDFLQFSFRWMNCLLLREFPLPCVIRLWDSYIAEPSEGFSTFHVYVCAVFLIYWSPQLKQMDFQQLMLFMQKLPTGKWRMQEIETLLAEAFVLKSLFYSSPKHLD